jgi:hypothetical protein
MNQEDALKFAASVCGMVQSIAEYNLISRKGCARTFTVNFKQN